MEKIDKIYTQTTTSGECWDVYLKNGRVYKFSGVELISFSGWSCVEIDSFDFKVEFNYNKKV